MPVGRADILFVVFVAGTGTNCEACELNFGDGPSYHAKRCLQEYQRIILSPLCVSEPSCDTKPYYRLPVGLYGA